jgi:hypothetical protein
MSKLTKLADDYGFDSVDEMAEATICDSVSPAICVNPGCNYTCDMEPDQDRGWCENCETNSVKSALVLMGVI